MGIRLDPSLLLHMGATGASLGIDTLVIDGVTADSRQAVSGQIFVAVRGEHTDGHDFISEALARGAACVVAERIPERADFTFVRVVDSRVALAVLAAAVHGDPTGAFALVGVTGTDGKTSTAMLVEAGMQAAGLTTGLIGTVAYRFAGESVDAPMTTPDAVMLNDLFARMVARGVGGVAMEVSSHALDQRRVEACRFDCALFTNLTRDHLDYHKTLSAYADAKMRLFTEVLPASSKAKGAVVNADDPMSSRIVRACPLPTLSFSLEKEADLNVSSSEVSLDGLKAEIRTPWGPMSIESPLLGRHNLANILAAIGACGVIGLPVREVAAGICRLDRIPGRMERVRGVRPLKVFVDYSHTPKALENALSVLRPLSKDGRIVVVMGAGGDRDRGKRPLMGQTVAQLADSVVVTSDNPRTEDPLAIIDQIMEGVHGVSNGRAAGHVVVEPDRRKAIAQAIRNAAARDVILIAGKGHEDYQIIGTKRIHFSDVEVAREMLDA